MPITARAQGKKFTFPDGTSPEDMGAAIDDYFSSQSSAVELTPEQQLSVQDLPITELTPPDVAEQIRGQQVLQPEKEQKTSLGQKALGALETAGAVVGGGALGALGQVAGTVEGVGREALTGGFSLDPTKQAQAAQRIAETAQQRSGQFASSAMPRTETGQEYLQSTAQALEPLSALPPVIGGQAGMIGLNAKNLFNYPKLTPRQKKIITELEQNPRNPDLAKFAVIGGKPKASADLKDAINKFGNAETIAVIKASSPRDKALIKKMVDIVKQGKKDPLFKDSNRVGDIVGDSLAKRVRTIKGIMNNSGKEIDNIARNKLKGKTVDLSDAKAKLKKDLDDLRVDYDPDTGEIDFTGSALEGSGASKARDIVKRVALRLKDNSMDAADAHFMKRLIDQQTAFGTSDRGLAGQIENSIKDLRRNINQSIRNVSKEYEIANTKYSDAIGALDSLQEAAGSKLNLDNPAALGTKARSFTNNTQTRARLIGAFENMQDVLRKNGITFKDDILTQNHIANALENRFKTEGTTTFRSKIATAGRDVAQTGVEAARDIATGYLGSGIRKGASAISKIGTVTDEQAIESLLKILE